MTLLEIIQRSVINLGEDIDDDTINEYKAGFGITAHINNAYMQVCEKDYRPFCINGVLLDSDGCFNPSVLPKTIVLIEAIFGENSAGVSPVFSHYSLPSGLVKVVGHQDEMVDVVYKYVPESLVNDLDVPVFPDRFHDCLADYAAYRIMGIGSTLRQQRGMFFLEEFERKRRLIRPFGEELGGMFSFCLKNKF